MGRPERLELINKIQSLRKSRVICYITGDRENISTRIAPDVIPVFYRHLELLGSAPAIDLLLYTRGGDVLTPWRLVQLIREYTREFCVLVPFRAYSAGTLLCLGADSIVMGRMGELGPIDPSVVNAFNPEDPCNVSARIPVNIEDVYSYLALAGEKASPAKGDMFQSFMQLASRIHPLALGNVHRNYQLIRFLARKMLALRGHSLGEEKVDCIVDYLTEKLYAHNYMITRREALEDIGLPVILAGPEAESLLWSLYQDFSREFMLGEPFEPGECTEGSCGVFEVVAGAVESQAGQDVFVYSGSLEKSDYKDSLHVNVNIRRQYWKHMV